MKCTGTSQNIDSCQEEKFGCKGCYYYQDKEGIEQCMTRRTGDILEETE